MKKFTLQTIVEKTPEVNEVTVQKIIDLKQSMKDCRERIVVKKKELAYNIEQFDRNLEQYAKWIKGEIIQDEKLFHYIELDNERLARDIMHIRTDIRNDVKLLYELRKQNNELFAKLCDESAKLINEHNTQTIKLDKSQAKIVFNKLYDLLESGKDFKEVTIKIG